MAFICTSCSRRNRRTANCSSTNATVMGMAQYNVSRGEIWYM